MPPFVLAFAVLMLVFWVNNYGSRVLQTLGVWIEVALAGVAGGVVGMLVTYGMLSSVIGQVRLRLEPIPEHVDGASGLAPVGQLFGRQAAVVGVLVVYSIVWWFLLPQSNYSSWAVEYGWIILIAVACEVAAFVAPLWGFHLSMTAYRAHLLDEADELGTRIARLRHDPVGRRRGRPSRAAVDRHRDHADLARATRPAPPVHLGERDRAPPRGARRPRRARCVGHPVRRHAVSVASGMMCFMATPNVPVVPARVRLADVTPPIALGPLDGRYRVRGRAAGRPPERGRPQP